MSGNAGGKPNTFGIDGREVDIRAGETIFRAARRLGIKLPHLCYLPKPGYRPDGNCRVCMVEIEGERVLAASCIRTPTPGMKVKTQTERAKTARRMVVELLITEQPPKDVAHDPQSEFWQTADRQKVTASRFPRRAAPAPDRSHPAMAVNLDACVQGRFGFDYVSHPHRLMQPLIRKDGVPKHAHDTVDPANPWTHFRPASWDEALDRAAAGLKTIRDRDGSKALAGFGSAKASNEEAYLFQKLVRAGFGTNNVDHCTRLCHASSVAALLETIGSGAVTATFNECKNSDVIILIGANPPEQHPRAAPFFKQAAKRGTTLIVIDPRRPALANHAHYYVRYKPGTDVAFLNGLMHVIIAEGLTDQEFIAQRTEDFEALKATVARYTPELVEKLTGVPAEQV